MRLLFFLVVAAAFLNTACTRDTEPKKSDPQADQKQALMEAVENDITPPAEAETTPVYKPTKKDTFTLQAQNKMKPVYKHCVKSLKKVPNPLKTKEIKAICADVKQELSCYSEKGQPIFHYDRPGVSKKGKRILTISLIHGDEHASGTVGARWMSRLQGIDPRNSWRVIPVVNPDGWDLKTRMNARGVDINRNFPSKDWDKLALSWWTKKKKSDPRRYPGPHAASETETNCLIKQIENFKPDFIIAIHTPLGLLDFDGPAVKAPKSIPYRWHRLGNFPGSLGRYMWKDHNVPVLTIELKGSRGISKLERFDNLQDISGTVAMRASKILDSKKKQIKKTN